MDVDIILDAGHGGFDNGASYMGRAEKDDVLRLTLAVGAKLKEAGYHVYYTRTTDIYNSPTEKSSPCQSLRWKIFYFLSPEFRHGRQSVQRCADPCLST